MINNNNNNIVHCKLGFNGQNRRFSFYGTEFTQLREQVSQLIGLPVNGFVLKYVDNESDLITVATNEEFAIALAISGKILRLRAEIISVPSPALLVSSPALPGSSPALPVSSPESPCSSPLSPCSSPVSPGPSPVSPISSPCSVEDFGNGHPYRKHHGHHGHHGHDHHHGHHGQHGQHNHHGHHGHHGPHGQGHRERYAGCKGDGFSKSDRVEKKIELLKLFLSQMPPDEALTPALTLRKAHLRQKIQKLDSRRAHWSEKDENSKRKKWEKKCHKEHKKHQKQDMKLTPEAIQQIHQLKLQIIALRPELCQLRLSKKQKKLELKNYLQTGVGDKEAIWQEILDTKVKMTQLKSQIQPLKQSIHDLKASCKQQ
jgi:hypothetical protein